MKEMANEKKDEPGPWKVGKDASSGQPAPSETPAEEVKEERERGEKRDPSPHPSSGLSGDEKKNENEPKRYIPPHLRNLSAREVAALQARPSATGLTPLSGSALRKKSHLPQINDEYDFPSL